MNVWKLVHIFKGFFCFSKGTLEKGKNEKKPFSHIIFWAMTYHFHMIFFEMGKEVLQRQSLSRVELLWWYFLVEKIFRSRGTSLSLSPSVAF